MAEPQPNIQIFNETSLDLPFSKDTFADVTQLISSNEGCSYAFVEVVYVDEDEIVRINNEHLEHDYVTDIITFRYDEESDNTSIEGTMFCCAPRIKEQAKELSESPVREFNRIFIHGLLHLAGYEDQTDDQQEQMTAKENIYLEMIKH